MDMTLDTGKAIHRGAIFAIASYGEGATWWADVAAELFAVVKARKIVAAASLLRT